MKLPHWLRCRWSVWSAPQLQAGVRISVLSERETGFSRLIQRRECLECGKVRLREVR